MLVNPDILFVRRELLYRTAILSISSKASSFVYLEPGCTFSYRDSFYLMHLLINIGKIRKVNKCLIEFDHLIPVVQFKLIFILNLFLINLLLIQKFHTTIV